MKIVEVQEWERLKAAYNALRASGEDQPREFQLIGGSKAQVEAFVHALADSIERTAQRSGLDACTWN